MWGKRSKSVHVLALSVDPPPTGWGRKGTYLDCSMFDHLVLVEDAATSRANGEGSA
jgi:hypothetical protein